MRFVNIKINAVDKIRASLLIDTKKIESISCFFQEEAPDQYRMIVMMDSEDTWKIARKTESNAKKVLHKLLSGKMKPEEIDAIKFRGREE